MHPTYLGPRIQQETQPYSRIPAGGEREPTALPQTLRSGISPTALDQTVQRLMQEGLATSTQRSYMAGKRKFLSCHDSNTSPLPLTEQKLSNFVAFAVNQGLRHQTTCRLSATCKLSGGRRSQGDGYASTGADAACCGLPAASAFLVSFGRGR